MADANDAQVMVQLARWGTDLGMGQAITAVLSDEFDPENATTKEPAVRDLLYFFETVGTLTKNGLLDQALILDWLWVSGVWSRVGPAARRDREAYGQPALYENFETLAQAQGG